MDTINLFYQFNYKFKINDNIKKLNIDNDNYNIPINLSNSKLEYFKLNSYKFKSEIILPKTLKHVDIYCENTTNEINFIDTQLETIIFKFKNYNFDINLPQSLIKLNIICNGSNPFTSNKIILPKSLKELKICRVDLKQIEFNECELQYILLEKTDIWNSNQQFANYKLFNHSNKLKYACINNIELKNIDLNEINNVEELSIYNCNFNHDFKNFNNLKKLYITHSSFNQLLTLPNLNLLWIYETRFNQTLNNLQNIQNLKIESEYFNQKLDNLSSKLNTLILNSNKFNHPLDLLPQSLEILELNIPKYDYNIVDLPSSITNLKLIIDTYDKDIILPSSLEIFEIKNYSNIILPASLKEVYIRNIETIYDSINDKFKIQRIPDNLQLISNSTYFKDELTKLNILNKSDCIIFCHKDEHLHLLKNYKNIQSNKKIKLYTKIIYNKIIDFEDLIDIYDI